ncbi:MAG: uridine diphosphate-N-acetylglucosamine-binding protein YvcK [Anaerolineae bacterium]
MNLNSLSKWFTVGIGVKRWLIVLVVGICLITVGINILILAFIGIHLITPPSTFIEYLVVILLVMIGFITVLFSVRKFSRNILEPYRKTQQGRVVDVVYSHRRRQKELRVVAIGGGTGLPSVLRGLKQFTGNITAVVTVADDGGSSGRLRRELGVLPPGDIRNNIAALADDESLMTQLFQYRFDTGDLGGHAFGNLFITALAGVTGSIETALIETERVLNIQGRVIPATLDNVNLAASIKVPNNSHPIRVEGESNITKMGGAIAHVEHVPPDDQSNKESTRANLDADLEVIGPGSLYTSILPNLLVKGIAEALRGTNAYVIYVCNVATQSGETDDFTVAEHVMALEQHIGRGLFQLVLANNIYPIDNAGTNTKYVQPAPPHHEILQRYEVRYTDLTDTSRPWRHDPQKLVAAILQLSEEERIGTGTSTNIFTET